MRLAVPLDLRRLVDPLPARPGLGVLPVDRPAGERLDDGEHPAVAEVPVVGDREHLAARLLLVGRHPLPQVPRVVAPVRLVDGERLDPARLRAVVPEDHVAMQVVAAGVRGPLVADERGEAARVVRLVRRLDGLAPGRAVGRRAGEELERLGERPLGERDDDLERGVRPLARLDHVVPAAPGRVRQHLRVTGEQLREEPHVVGVIGDDQEIERPGQLHALPARRHDLLALREAVGVTRADPGAEGSRVHREGRVEVRVAEERARGEAPARIGGVRGLLEDPLGRRLVERAGVRGGRRLGPRRHGKAKAQHERDDHGESLDRHGLSAPSRRVVRTRRHPVIRAANRPTNQTAATIPMA